MTVRRLLMPLTLITMTACASSAVAQQPSFPAPLPNQTSAPSNFPPVNAVPAPSQPAPAFPAVNGAGAPTQRQQAAAPAAPPSAFPSPTSAAASQGVFQGGFGGAPPRASAEQDECMAKFAPLRADAEKRAKMIQTASARKAGAQEACNLLKAYVAAEKKVVDYVTTKQTACNIPAEVPTQLKANQLKSNDMMKQVCQAATAQAQGGGAGPAAAPSLSEVLGSTNVPTETRTVRRGGSTFDTINGNVLAR